MMTLNRITVLLSISLTSLQSNSVSAFTTSASLAFQERNIGFATNNERRNTWPQTKKTPTKMMMPGHEHMLYDLDSVQTSMQSAHDLLHLHTSMLLSDAADATEAVKDDWWTQYLQGFKGALVLVHSVIDGPLRSVGITQTWGPSIFLFTFGVRSLVLPLSVQQAKSSEYTKALKPYQDEIKKKFKDNKDMINRATAKLFEDSGTNPLTGCLISLSQIPIFIGLYRSINLLAKEGVIDEPFLWIPSLQGPVTAPTYRGMEWLTQGWTVPDGGLPIPQLGWATTLAFIVMPVVLVLGQTLTMKVLTPATDMSAMSKEEQDQFEKSQVALKFLPLLIGYFSLQVPAGLTIYWFTSNFFTLSQSLAVRTYYKANPPKIELPDYWDALDDVDSMTPEDKRAAAEAGISAGPNYDDMLDEAQFHYVVERKPLREHSAAWKLVKVGNNDIPIEFQSWVNGATKLELEKEPANV